MIAQAPVLVVKAEARREQLLQQLSELGWRAAAVQDLAEAATVLARDQVDVALLVMEGSPGNVRADATCDVPSRNDMGMVGDSPALRRLRAEIRKAGPTEAPVLLAGESGTGKELVARALHDASRRAKGPFVPVNCGAL